MNIKKLKPDRSFWNALVPLVCMLLFGLGYLFFGLYTAFYILASGFGVYVIYNIIALIRTHKYGYIITTVYLTLVSLLTCSFPNSIKTGNDTFTRYMLIGMVFWGVAMWVQILTKNMKWRGREIFELAAKSVEDTSSGYTARPKPIGTTDYSRHQLLSFAEFARRRLLALVEINRDSIRFYPIKMGQETPSILRFGKEDSDLSYVSFEFDGPLSVYISERDYFDFKDDLAFDLLCESLGNVYRDFIDLYRTGEENTIFQKLNSLGYGCFS